MQVNKVLKSMFGTVAVLTSLGLTQNASADDIKYFECTPTELWLSHGGTGSSGWIESSRDPVCNATKPCPPQTQKYEYSFSNYRATEQEYVANHDYLDFYEAPTINRLTGKIEGRPVVFQGNEWLRKLCEPYNRDVIGARCIAAATMDCELKVHKTKF